MSRTDPEQALKEADALIELLEPYGEPSLYSYKLVVEALRIALHRLAGKPDPINPRIECINNNFSITPSKGK